MARWRDFSSIIAVLSSILLSSGFLRAGAVPAVQTDSDPDPVSVHGVVLDPQGQPIAGASVMAVGDAWTFEKPIAQTRSEKGGSFTISFRKSFFDFAFSPWENTAIAGTSPAYPTRW